MLVTTRTDRNLPASQCKRVCLREASDRPHEDVDPHRPLGETTSTAIAGIQVAVRLRVTPRAMRINVLHRPIAGFAQTTRLALRGRKVSIRLGRDQDAQILAVSGRTIVHNGDRPTRSRRRRSRSAAQDHRRPNLVRSLVQMDAPDHRNTAPLRRLVHARQPPEIRDAGPDDRSSRRGEDGGAWRRCAFRG